MILLIYYFVLKIGCTLCVLQQISIFKEVVVSRRNNTNHYFVNSCSTTTWFIYHQRHKCSLHAVGSYKRDVVSHLLVGSDGNLDHLLRNWDSH